MASTDTWVRRWVRRPEAQKRIFCFPWAGGGAVSFRRLAVELPADVELCAVEYPGRGSRGNEPALTQVSELSSGVGGVVAPLLDRPFLVVGFSLGALVAFEWVRSLVALGGPTPNHFLPCARRAPHLPPRHLPLHDRRDDDLLVGLQERFGPVPELLLREPELLARFLMPLRADLVAVERHIHAPGPALPCPVTAIGGARDPDVSEFEIREWRVHTTGPFACTILDAGHFLLEAPTFREVLERLLD